MKKYGALFLVLGSVIGTLLFGVKSANATIEYCGFPIGSACFSTEAECEQVYGSYECRQATPISHTTATNVLQSGGTASSLSYDDRLKILNSLTASVFAQVDGSAKVSFDTTLKTGSTGGDVQLLQEFLIENKYLTGTTADGIFGSKTTTAVKLLQATLGTTADGVVGAGTVAKLNEALSSPATTDTKQMTITDLALQSADTTKTVNQRIDAVSSATDQTLNLISNAIGADNTAEVKLAATEGELGTLFVKVSALPNVDQEQLARLKEFLSRPAKTLEERATRAEASMNQILYILDLLKTKAFPESTILSIGRTAVAPFDVATYDTKAAQDEYEKYAKSEIDTYIEKNKIDITQNFVGRESTFGKLTPGKIFVVPNKYIVKTQTNGQLDFAVKAGFPSEINTGYLISTDPNGGNPPPRPSWSDYALFIESDNGDDIVTGGLYHRGLFRWREFK